MKDLDFLISVHFAMYKETHTKQTPREKLKTTLFPDNSKTKKKN